ncbi:hypothetical protein MG5_00921 [Candida albicans P57072]|nr:hypothetical protein MG1_00934 [Candida albicans GC75]KGR14186.1 hypothetical protein MG5_00921 [Candida albicans P57072]KGU13205.1 hypothetical protein MEQ_00921 [Candida albicans P87]KHC40967.1 Planktonic growth-induced protein [Candida albicans P76055]KHC41633.1 Planktonic growth-induced protein [Candida albicans P76067]
MYSQSRNFHNHNTHFNECMFFNPETPQQICPRVWLGPYNALINKTDNYDSNFLVEHNIKIIINCGTTLQFLDLIENNRDVSVPSDVLILSLDPFFQSHDELAVNFVQKYSRILTNYLNYFYKSNPNAAKLIEQLPNSTDRIQISSPILCGTNLMMQFFSLIKLIDLFKSVNQEMEVLIISQDGNDNLSTGLMIAYLMDTYRYNLLNSFNMIKSRRPSIYDWSSVEYDALLKQFYAQICETNCPTSMDTIKRSSQEDDNEVLAGGDRKRRFLN